jgi:MFS family permease
MRGIDTYFKQNVIGISSVEFLWGLGLPVVIESTFLQLFLKSLGASSFEVGLIPALFFIGCSVFALFSSYITSDMAFKRGAVVLLHLVSGISLVFFGVFLYFYGNVSAVLLVFFISYAVFSVCIGMTLPVWLNYLVNILSPDRSVSGLGVMMIAQSVARLTSSLFIIKWVERYAFSLDASAWVFITVGLLFALGSLFFLVTREIPAAENGAKKHSNSFLRYVKASVRHMLANKNFLFFLVADLDFYVVVTVISFYANYATTFCGIEAHLAAGAFVTCIYTGAIIVNIFLGSLNMFSLKHKYIFSKTASISAMVLLFLFSYQWSFFLSSLLMGAARGTRMVVFAPTVKKLSGLEDSTSYFAVAPILTAVFASGLPMFFGKFLDHFAWLNGWAYRIVFLLSACLILGTLYCLKRVDFQDARI